MKIIVTFVYLGLLILPVFFHPILGSSPSWQLSFLLSEREGLSSTMSKDGAVFAVYQGVLPEFIEIVDAKGTLINTIETKKQIGEEIIYASDIISLSHTGKYLAAAYYAIAPEKSFLRVWNTSSSELVLEIENINYFSFMFSINNNWLLFNTHKEFGDQQGDSVIYDLDEGVEKARFVGEDSGQFTDINTDGTGALMIGNDNVFYYIELEDSFEKLPITTMEFYDNEYSLTNEGKFYTSDLIALNAISDQGRSVRFFQFAGEEFAPVREIYYLRPNEPIIDENVFGFQNLEYYSVEFIDPLNEEAFFIEDVEVWQYLAISPDGKWIASHNWLDETLSIYSYPSMVLVTKIENCRCDYLEFNTESTRFMTVSDDEETSRVLIFELTEE